MVLGKERKMKKSLLLILLFLIALDPTDLLAQDSQMVLDQEVLAESVGVLDSFLEKLEAIQPNEDGEYILEIPEDEMEHNIILGAYFSAFTQFRSDSASPSHIHPYRYRSLDRRGFERRRQLYKGLFDDFAKDHKINTETQLHWHTSTKNGVNVSLNFDESYIDVKDNIDGTIQRRSFSGILNGDLYQGSVSGLHQPDSPATKGLQAIIRQFQSDPEFHTLFHATRMQMRVYRTREALRRGRRALTRAFGRLLIGAIGLGAIWLVVDATYPGGFGNMMTNIYNLSPESFEELTDMIRNLRNEWSSTTDSSSSDSFAFEEEER